MTAHDRLAGALGVLETRHRLRRLAPRQGLDFASNDYLGLAASQAMADAAQEALDRGVPLGSGGSRLLRGNHPEHEALEADAMAFFGTEAALFMGGGFQANQAIFATLPAKGDLILHDALIHASAHEGMRIGRADTRAFAHNDMHAARAELQAWRDGGGTGQVWIAVESVYSMDGDMAPLSELAALAKTAGAVLIVDEAHATGIFGDCGRGLAHGLEADCLTLHTCGKALGVVGGLICGPKVMVDTLINRARPFIFATAPPPFYAALVRQALTILRTQPHWQSAALARLVHAHGAAARHCKLDGLRSQIIPVIIGTDVQTMAWATSLQSQGFDVRGIRPPTVPRGTSRLRVSITGNVTTEDITDLFEAIGRLRDQTE